MDFLLALCRWLIVHRLQMKRREKWSIIVALSLGCLAGVACAIKTAYLPLIGTWANFTYNIAGVLVWAMTESAITIVAASIPFMGLMMQDIANIQSVGRNIGARINIKEQASIDSKDKTPVRGDDQSDKSMLGDGKDSSHITQTREITIANSGSNNDVSNDELVP
ncbi:hypothetical protein SVAN01_08496 [Stagonosporopsis vannaccii]|nr:hypothetical protein SVAN01_08496 [Stagonosporopsis vannaccii]